MTSPIDMNPQVKALWVIFLRSSQVKQGKGSLSIGGFLCVLGTLCQVYATQHPGVAWANDGSFLGQSIQLPVEVVRWAGLINDDPVIYDPQYDGRCLSALNDLEDGLSFEELADLIERAPVQ